MIEETLKQCPFCNGDAQLLKRKTYTAYGYIVRCSQCFCRSHYIMVDSPQLKYDGIDEMTRYTDEQAQQIVADLWNMRAK